MLRRVARVLRVLLLGLGLLLLLWLPLSFVYTLTVAPSENVLVAFNHGKLEAWALPNGVLQSLSGVRLGLRRATGLWWTLRDVFLLPGVSASGFPGYGIRFINIPLWLLAFLCLAWPVTSFVIA